MNLDLTPLASGETLQLAACGIEGVADSDVKILVWFPLHNDFIARHGDVDTHVVSHPLMLVSMRDLDQDAARHDVVVKGLQLGSLFTDCDLSGFGKRYVPCRDLQG
jgi:hypothetical protein